MQSLFTQLAAIADPHGGSAISEPTLTLSSAHLSEVDAIIAADEAVTEAFKLLWMRVNAIGDTVHGDRYGELVQQIGYTLHDYMPAPRQHGDDPFDDGDA